MHTATVRTAVVVDLENVLLDARRAGSVGVGQRLRELGRVVRGLGTPVWGIGAGDPWLVRLALPTAAAAGVRLFTVPMRKDAADHLLIARVRDCLPASVERVVLATGDGGFADVAAELCGAGREVVVVAERRKTSARLRTAATAVVELPEFELALDLAA